LRAFGLYALLVTVSLVLAGATFLIISSPADLLRERLIEEVHSRTGRDLAVRGGASLTLFPSPGVVLRDVELAGPAGLTAPAVLRAETVIARLAWRPLIEGRVAVRALILTRALLDLVVDDEGRRNWDFAALDGRAAPIRLAQLAPRFGHGQGLPPDLYEALERSVSRHGQGRAWPDAAIGGSLQEVRVSGGMVRYSDARVGRTYEMSGVDLRVGRNPRGGTEVSGSWELAGERVAVEGEAQLRDAETPKLVLRVGARPFEATWEGSVDLASTVLDGRFTAGAASAAVLARWIANPPSGPRLDADGPVTAKGRLRVSGAAVDLSEATITLNGATATGMVAADLSRSRPFIKADLRLSELDLDRYLVSDPRKREEAEAPESSGADGRSEPAASIDDLLRRTEGEKPSSGTPTKAQVRGFTQRIGGTELMDPGALHLVDLNGRFEIGRLLWRGIVMEAVRVIATLDGGAIRGEVENAQLYGGYGRGVLTFRREGFGAAVGLTAAFDGVAVLPFMQDAVRFDWVEGRGHLTLALATQGASEREMVERLGGKAEFRVSDGAVIGWNVPHALRKLRQGQMIALDRDAQAKTPFAELAGSFAISNGVAVNQDLKMSGAAAQLTGAGTIAMPQRSVDYIVRPRLPITTAAHSNAADPLSIEIPVRIHGAWEQPRFTADLQGALNDPRTAETIQQLGRQLRSGNVDEAVKSFFGGGPEGEEKAAKAKEMLKRFLKQ
jgi:AsmA protein